MAPRIPKAPPPAAPPNRRSRVAKGRKAPRNPKSPPPAAPPKRGARAAKGRNAAAAGDGKAAAVNTPAPAASTAKAKPDRKATRAKVPAGNDAKAKQGAAQRAPVPNLSKTLAAKRGWEKRYQKAYDIANALNTKKPSPANRAKAEETLTKLMDCQADIVRLVGQIFGVQPAVAPPAPPPAAKPSGAKPVAAQPAAGNPPAARKGPAALKASAARKGPASQKVPAARKTLPPAPAPPARNDGDGDGATDGNDAANDGDQGSDDNGAGGSDAGNASAKISTSKGLAGKGLAIANAPDDDGPSDDDPSDDDDPSYDDGNDGKSSARKASSAGKPSPGRRTSSASHASSKTSGRKTSSASNASAKKASSPRRSASPGNAPAPSSGQRGSPSQPDGSVQHDDEPADGTSLTFNTKRGQDVFKAFQICSIRNHSSKTPAERNNTAFNDHFADFAWEVFDSGLEVVIADLADQGITIAMGDRPSRYAKGDSNTHRNAAWKITSHVLGMSKTHMVYRDDDLCFGIGPDGSVLTNASQMNEQLKAGRFDNGIFHYDWETKLQLDGFDGSGKGKAKPPAPATAAPGKGTIVFGGELSFLNYVKDDDPANQIVKSATGGGSIAAGLRAAASEPTAADDPSFDLEAAKKAVRDLLGSSTPTQRTPDVVASIEQPDKDLQPLVQTPPSGGKSVTRGDTSAHSSLGSLFEPPADPATAPLDPSAPRQRNSPSGSGRPSSRRGKSASPPRGATTLPAGQSQDAPATASAQGTQMGGGAAPSTRPSPSAPNHPAGRLGGGGRAKRASTRDAKPRKRAQLTDTLATLGPGTRSSTKRRVAASLPLAKSDERAKAVIAEADDRLLRLNEDEERRRRSQSPSPSPGPRQPANSVSEEDDMSDILEDLEKVKLDLSNLAHDIAERSEASDEVYDLMGEVDGVILAVSEANEALTGIHHKSVDHPTATSVLPMLFNVIEEVRGFKERHGLGDVKRGSKRCQTMQESSEAPAAADRPIKRARTKRSGL
jgi:hypothetical protein